MGRLRWVALMGVVVLAACAERRPQAARPVFSIRQAEPSRYAVPLQQVLSAPTAPEGLEAVAAGWEEVRTFYAARKHEPLFLDRDGVNKDGREVQEAVRSARADGLHPERYHVQELAAKLAPLESKEAPPEVGVQAELALVEAALRFARELSVGQTTPQDGGARWDPPEFSTAAALERLAKDGPEATFEQARPQWPEYAALREALAQHRELAARGGWPIIDKGPILEPGADDPRVPVLRQRLLVTGELGKGDVAEGTVYDEKLVEAVKRFQRRHGLGEDGRVGGRTLKALRASVEERIAQLELNLERWRWMPARPEGRAVLVNVVGFELFAYDGGERVLRMRVIAGLPEWPTPQFTDEIESLMVHPTWVVPKQILSREILPKLREDPEYANKVGLQVVDTAQGAAVPSSEVDWLAVDDRANGYRLKQAPGSRNPLGAIKFELPNKYSVYLHHTDNPSLFDDPNRALSHGCVRVEDPFALTKFLLGPEGEDAYAEVETLVADRKSRRVTLPEKVPVRMVYFTAWKDDDGSVQFREDLYRHDARLARALERERQDTRLAGTSANPAREKPN